MREAAALTVEAWSSAEALSLLSDERSPLSSLGAPQLVDHHTLKAHALCWVIERSEVGAQLTLCVEGEVAWRDPTNIPLPTRAHTGAPTSEAPLWAALTLDSLVRCAASTLS